MKLNLLNSFIYSMGPSRYESSYAINLL